MLDHVSVYVTNYQKSKAFYEAALASLGYKLHMEFEGKVGGLGAESPDVWLVETTGKPTIQHVALRAQGEEQVKAFYTNALSAGGKDNGAPGPRPNYGDDYYAAFVFDPDGHNIEVVCHLPKGA